jgi:pimeloyl-ACP methyl ester carboxylesterase
MLYHLIVGEGKPLLILHGVALDHRYMMDTLEPAFNDLESWKWIYVDMPGHGQASLRAVPIPKMTFWRQ